MTANSFIFRPGQFLVALAIGLSASQAVISAQESKANRQAVAFFEKKIRPVLVQHCYECHSATAKKVQGGLLLDSREGLLRGGESGPSIVPGKPQQSLLIQALKFESFEMPPKRQLPDGVINDFVKWVQQGAVDPRVATTVVQAADSQPPAPPGINVEEGKKFWAFQSITKPEPPKVKESNWSRTEIDRFVLASLEEHKLTPAADADPRTLIRRLYYDLTGLPPTPEETVTFAQSYAADRQASVEALVDSLLASRQFGERWGRHWLDVARYGESNGNVRNSTFPYAWRYRDYVIAAFNADKPYDRFLTEQIAGDLLQTDSQEERNANLTATGFLALGSKPNAQGNPNFQMDVVADQIETVTTAAMALTVACARCHDHKYDPIPTRDYYALAGIFTSSETLYGAGGNNMGGAPPTDLHVLATKDSPAPLPVVQPEEAGTKGKKKGNAKGKAAPKYPAGTPLAMGVRDRTTPADCKINLRGELRQLGAAVPRGFIQVCTIGEPPALDAEQSGRLQLAQWITAPQHPLTARVAVNRIWHHLFGQGIVRTPDNFGLHGEPPTHPELLDYLATKFVADGWSFKKFIRSVVLSRVYQMSSEFDASSFTADPDNLYLWRHQRRRLDAESFRDSALAVSGQLDRSPGEGSVLARLGEALIQDKLTPDKIHQPSNRRSIYLCILRNGEPEELTVFDLADPSLVVGARNVTTVPAQGLFLMNSPFMVQQAERFAERVLAWQNPQGNANDANRIGLAYQLALQREPTSAELKRAEAFLRSAQVELYATTPDQRRRAWSALGQSLYSTNEFRHID
ncbi:Planctomycete cytochrome C [Anatilimnocola aggregata]|uniref:Planctomycete cytochrome C n=1 Tax=Anatilimnocola aggregata TaxID=2528021 RepID=A0A517YA51_9BACT|nr:PSD1 and planctomycete cytochrome C domain-containing protein [Anatilimnocola aggregata]QDU27098.1 Planctomycete cytochrome C [Anatilimnocola aggregata]